MQKPHTVVVVIEAKDGKENELQSALENIVEPCRAEESCLDYHLHKSVDNAGQFILYETWISKEKHQEQFSKPYIIDLIGKIEGILAKPYQAWYANELKPN